MENEKPKLQAFKINLSKGDGIPCDAEELPKIMQAIKSGSPCIVKSGLFNPSYFVSITEDTKRIEDIRNENATIYEDNERRKKYGGTLLEYKGLQPLKDIFEGVNLHTQPALKKGDNSIPKIGQM